MDKENNVKARRDTYRPRLGRFALFGLMGIPAAMICFIGCQSKDHLIVGKQMTQIQVSQTDTAEVLELLPEKGLLATAEAVSVYNKSGWSRELGIVQFNADDSLVKRKVYVQVRSELLAPPFSREKLYIYVQTVLPAELLNEPYENESRKNIEVIHRCRELIINDSRPYEEDKNTVSLIGMARSALNEALLQLADRPREAPQLSAPEGFPFDHTIYGKAWIKLETQEEDIYTLKLTSTNWVDPVQTW
jgi:hypothetical protein